MRATSTTWHSEPYSLLNICKQKKTTELLLNVIKLAVSANQPAGWFALT